MARAASSAAACLLLAAVVAELQGCGDNKEERPQTEDSATEHSTKITSTANGDAKQAEDSKGSTADDGAFAPRMAEEPQPRVSRPIMVDVEPADVSKGRTADDGALATRMTPELPPISRSASGNDTKPADISNTGTADDGEFAARITQEPQLRAPRPTRVDANPANLSKGRTTSDSAVDARERDETPLRAPRPTKVYANLHARLEPSTDQEPSDPLADEVASWVRLAAQLLHAGASRHSGVSAPSAETPAARCVANALEASFRQRSMVERPRSSASGASFVRSHDGLFIAKSLRDQEFVAMERHLMPRFRVVPTATGISLAKSLVGHSALNLPVLAFGVLRRPKNWVVIPDVVAARALAWTGDAAARPLGQPEVFDVKPFKAKSLQRKAFFRRLADLDFVAQPGDWKQLLAVLGNDTSLLERLGPFVDYSFLFELYSVSPAGGGPTNALGPTCVRSQGCNQGSCRVLCVNIIDYFMLYDEKPVWYDAKAVGKKLESWFIGNKWDDYAAKAQLMMRCIGVLPRMGLEEGVAVEARDSHSFAHDGRLAVVLFAGRPPWERAIVTLTQIPALPPEGRRCETYLDAACGGVAADISPTHILEHRGKAATYAKAECVFTAPGPAAHFCKAALILQCAAWMKKQNPREVIRAARLADTAMLRKVGMNGRI